MEKARALQPLQRYVETPDGRTDTGADRCLLSAAVCCLLHAVCCPLSAVCCHAVTPLVPWSLHL